MRPAGKRIRLTGEVADPANPPPGCHFHPRCPYAEEICKLKTPPLKDTGNGHLAACHFAEKLKLNGVIAEGTLGKDSGGTGT